MPAISPLAPAGFPDLKPIAGVRLAAYAAGVRYAGRNDVMLAELAPGTTIAGVLTQSTTPGAPVDWCRASLPGGSVRAIVVNSGNANVFTGRSGREVCERTAAAAAQLFGCSPREIFISSTGVIGEPPPAEKIVNALPNIVPLLDAAAWEPAARAIMTTDTFPKGATATATIDGANVRINGFAKGSGMIAPDMATMLSYIFTDAEFDAASLDRMLRQAAHVSFNMLSVDTDTSTSDTCVLLANGAAGPVSEPEFQEVLTEGCIRMTEILARDGEGAKHLLRCTVRAALDETEARMVAKSLVNSPLIKTMVHGADPNVGRILMAVGKCFTATIRTDVTDAWVNGHAVVRGGTRVDFDEPMVRAALATEVVDLEVSLGVGSASATAYGCDLTTGYVEENAAYYSS